MNAGTEATRSAFERVTRTSKCTLDFFHQLSKLMNVLKILSDQTRTYEIMEVTARREEQRNGLKALPISLISHSIPFGISYIFGVLIHLAPLLILPIIFFYVSFHRPVASFLLFKLLI